MIVALWVLFLLGAMALVIDACVRPQLSIAGRLKHRTKASYLMKAGFKKALAQVLEDKTASDSLNDLWSNNEGAFKDVAAGDGTFSVSYETADYGPPAEDKTGIRYGLIDEERKININKVPYSVLTNFFQAVGKTNPDTAAQIADSIIDWRDADDQPRPNGAESIYYLTLDPPYSSKNANFQVLEELLLVKGMTPEIFDAVKSRITLYGEGAVNINTADSLVLRCVGISDGLSSKIIYFRSGADGKEATGDDNAFDSISTVVDKLKGSVGLTKDEETQLRDAISAGLICVTSNNFMGYSTARLGMGDKSSTATFIFNRDKSVKYWRED